MAADSPSVRVLRLIREQGLIRSVDLDRRGIHRMHLKRLVDRGVLVRVSRGVYGPAESPVGAHSSLHQVVTRVPHATICLLTALRVHGLTTQSPSSVWIMIDGRARRPALEQPSIRVVRASGASLHEGVDDVALDGMNVKVTTVAKTVADCFKYRRHVGTDVAIEALREAWLERRVTVDELMAMARVDRVATVIRPYIEAVV